MKVRTEPIYRCDICFNESVWKPGWHSIMRAFGKGYAGWEHVFHVCGTDCEKKLNDMSKKEREKLAYLNPNTP